MYTLKPAFNGATVNYQNKKVVLNKDLSEDLKTEMIASGLGRYFEGNPVIKKEAKVVKFEVIKKGGNGDEIENGFKAAAKEAADDKANASPASKYDEFNFTDLKAQAAERNLPLGTAKSKAAVIAILEADDKANA